MSKDKALDEQASPSLHLDDLRRLFEGLELAYKARLNEDALLRRAQKLADLVGRQDGCAVSLDVYADKVAAAAVDRHGIRIIGASVSRNAKDALEKLCDDALSSVRDELKTRAGSRFHQDRAWAAWAENRLAEIEAEYEREVAS